MPLSLAAPTSVQITAALCPALRRRCSLGQGEVQRICSGRHAAHLYHSEGEALCSPRSRRTRDFAGCLPL